MAETTLNSPLSGLEVRTAILDKIGFSLERDCNLNMNSSYEWFTANIKIALDMQDAGVHVKVDRDLDVKQGTEPGWPVNQQRPETGNAIEHEFDIDPAAPNTVRIETGQGVPVQAKDEEGRTVTRQVHYARPGAKKKG
jgi:hypothetical protein